MTVMTMMQLAFLLAVLMSLSIGGIVAEEATTCEFIGVGKEFTIGYVAVPNIVKTWKVGEQILHFVAQHKGNVTVAIETYGGSVSATKYFELKKIEVNQSTTNISLNLKTSLTEDYDREKINKTLMINVVCKGPNKLKNLQCTITVLPDNAHEPKFKNAAYSYEVREDHVNQTALRSELETIQAYDEDRYQDQDSELTFSLLDKELKNAESPIFQPTYIRFNDSTVSTYNISITLIAPLDFQVQKSYDLILVAKDPNYSSNCSVSIHVKDVDNLNPFFSQLLYHATVEENELSEDWIVLNSTEKIYAADGDTGINTTITYSIDETLSDIYTQLDIFVPLSEDECKVKLQNSASLKEKGHNYFVVFIVATQIDNPIRRNSTVLKVYLESTPVTTSTEITGTSPSSPSPTTSVLPDTSLSTPLPTIPGFPQSVYDFILTPAQAINVIVYTLRANDNTAKYKMDDDDYFKINYDTGAITLVKSVQNIKHRTATIYAEKNNVQIGVATIHVQVLRNNEGLQFAQHFYNISIKENDAPKIFHDLHVDTNISVTYKIFSGVYGKFAVDSTTGDLSVPSLDYEDISLHVLEVVVSSENKSDNLQDDAIVFVNVIDVNEPPYFTKANTALSVGVASFHRPGQTYPLQEAEDDDEKENGALSYSLKEETSEFDVQPHSGDLQLESQPSDKIVTLTLVAKDGGSPSLTDELAFKVFKLADNEVFIITQELTRTKRSTRAYRQPQYQTVLSSVEEKLGVQVGLVQATRNSTNSRLTDLYLFARQNETILTFSEIIELSNDKKLPYSVTSLETTSVSRGSNGGDDDSPSGTVIAVYILAAVVFAMVAAAIGLFVFNRWSKAAKRRSALDSTDNDDPSLENQRIEDASVEIFHHKYQNGGKRVSEEQSVDTYMVDTDDTIPVLAASDTNSDKGIENPLAQYDDRILGKDDPYSLDEPYQHSQPEDDTKKDEDVEEGSLRRKIKAAPALSPFSDDKQSKGTITPVENVEVEPVLTTSNEDFKNLGVTKEEDLSTVTSEQPSLDTADPLPPIQTEIPEDTADPLPLIQTEIPEEEAETQSLDESSATKAVGSEAKPLKKCLKTDLHAGRRKSTVSFNETAEVITVIEEDASSKL